MLRVFRLRAAEFFLGPIVADIRVSEVSGVRLSTI